MKSSGGSNYILIDNSEAVLKELQNKVDRTLEAVGMHLEGEAKEELENNPRRIDTGLLRNSITHAVSGKPPAITNYKASNASRYNSRNEKAYNTIMGGHYTGTAPNDPEEKKGVYIGTNVKYAIYVHEGTSRMTPNRFLKNACTRNQDQVKKYIENSLKGSGAIGEWNS